MRNVVINTLHTNNNLDYIGYIPEHLEKAIFMEEVRMIFGTKVSEQRAIENSKDLNPMTGYGGIIDTHDNMKLAEDWNL